MTSEFPHPRKQDKPTGEQRLKRAVFAAMRSGCANPVGPTAISKSAGLSKSLVYKRFGSVDALVMQAIREMVRFPPPTELISPSMAEGGGLERAAAAFEELRQRLEPEVLDLLTWSLGNADQIALAVMTSLFSYCDELALEFAGDISFRPLFIGKFVELLSARQAPE